MIRKIAIVGGSGFIGTRLIETLLNTKNFQILNVDKQPSLQYPEITRIANVLDKETLQSLLHGIDLVVLLAAEHRDDVTPVSLYHDVNVKGMLNTLEAMERNGVKRIIFTSTVAVYGLNKENPNEDTLIDPFNYYGKSKWKAEQVLQEWFKTHNNWNINIIRPSVIFGEKNRGNVYNLLNQISSGKFIMIGNGNNMKSMSYIGNIIAFIHFLILDKDSGYNVYNYVDKPDLTTNDLVFYIANLLERKVPTLRIPYWLGMLAGYGFDVLALLLQKKLSISSVRVKKFCAITQYDSTKVMDSGFQAPYTIQEGLKNTLILEFGKCR